VEIGERKLGAALARPAARMVRSLRSPFAALVFFAACGGSPPVASGPAMGSDTTPDLPLGDFVDDGKADGTWGDALNCKTIPDLPQLVSPQITISLEGLTLHLVDAASGYDKVFPIGPGQIERDETQAEFGDSKSYYPVIATGGHDFALRPKTATACKTWWTDPDTGDKAPVFAGLPFMPFYGAYAIHGPIDGYTSAVGGALRRGYVSHGCVRLQAADITEIYARVKTLDKVPVHLQREPERTPSGARVDLASNWIGAECATDADCTFTGGFCHANPYGGRGYCSAHCAHACADKATEPTTFCVADPSDSTQGMCVSQNVAQNPDCRQFGQMTGSTLARYGQASASAKVCTPGSRGWVGDPCLGARECLNGSTCVGVNDHGWGYCSEPCTSVCPDEPGTSATACVNDPIPASGLATGCLRACTAASNGSECEGGTTCVPRTTGATRDTRMVCRPTM
jgi:hypothetical protein